MSRSVQQKWCDKSHLLKGESNSHCSDLLALDRLVRRGDERLLVESQVEPHLDAAVVEADHLVDLNKS